MGLVVDRLVLGLVVLAVLQFSSVSSIPQTLPTHSFVCSQHHTDVQHSKVSLNKTFNEKSPDFFNPNG